MSKINWNEAPEGATHYDKSNYVWVRTELFDGTHTTYYWRDERWNFTGNSILGTFSLIAKPIINTDHRSNFDFELNPYFNPHEPQNESTDSGKHYRFEYKEIKLDPYRIFKIYNITEPAQQHVIKKLLVPGERGGKDLIQDIKESINGLNRWIEMIEEDLEDDNN
jgi:hypothetical protein